MVPTISVDRVPAVWDTDRQGQGLVSVRDVRDPECAAGNLDLAKLDAAGLGLATVACKPEPLGQLSRRLMIQHGTLHGRTKTISCRAGFSDIVTREALMPARSTSSNCYVPNRGLTEQRRVY